MLVCLMFIMFVINVSGFYSCVPHFHEKKNFNLQNDTLSFHFFVFISSFPDRPITWLGETWQEIAITTAQVIVPHD